MTESHITDEHIRILDNFNAWLKREIINKEIFTCNHQVDRKNNTILINKGSMTLSFSKKWIYLTSSHGTAILNAGEKLHEILLDALQFCLREHFVKTYEE